MYPDKSDTVRFFTQHLGQTERHENIEVNLLDTVKDHVVLVRVGNGEYPFLKISRTKEDYYATMDTALRAAKLATKIQIQPQEIEYLDTELSTGKATPSR